MSRSWQGVAAIAVVCLLCYGNSFDGGFHYDDFHSIVDNPAIRTLANTADFFIDPGLFSVDAEKRMYRPLLLLSYALNYALGEYEVRGYHLVNAGLHLVCSLLVWALSSQLCSDQRRGLFCALSFAVHPLGSEPVNYISSRSELLMACLFLCSCLAYIRFSSAGAWSWYIVSIAAGILALLTKSVAVVLVGVLAGTDWFLHGRQGLYSRWKYYLPFAGMALFYILFTRELVDRALLAPVRPLSVQVWTQAKALVYYLKLLAVPWNQNVEHQFFESGNPDEAAVAGGLALVGSLAILAWKGRRHRLLLFSLCWSAVVLLPATVTPLNMLVNERRLYLVMVGWGWISGYLSRFQGTHLLWVALPLLGLLTWNRNQAWQDELVLWQDAVDKAPHMYRAQTNLGKALQLAGEQERALKTYQRALEIDSRHGDAYNNMATIYHQQSKEYRARGRTKLADSRLDRAIEWYRKALERYPGYEEIYQNLGDAYTTKGQLDQALKMYEQALEIDVRNGQTWSNYGQTLTQTGQVEKAEQVFRKAVELLPTQAEPYNNLGNIYSAWKEFERAVDMYRQALEREPEARVEVLGNLGDTYREMGLLDQARQVLEEALALDSGQARLHYYLGRVERAAGSPAAAIEACRRAAQLDSGHVKTRVEWAEILEAEGEFLQAVPVFEAALQIDPGYSRAWYGLAQSLERAGQPTEALRAYRTFLEVWPHKDLRYSQVQERIHQLEQDE